MLLVCGLQKMVEMAEVRAEPLFDLAYHGTPTACSRTVRSDQRESLNIHLHAGLFLHLRHLEHEFSVLTLKPSSAKYYGGHDALKFHRSFFWVKRGLLQVDS
jgi:hypothetical protein